MNDDIDEWSPIESKLKTTLFRFEKPLDDELENSRRCHGVELVSCIPCCVWTVRTHCVKLESLTGVA